MTTILLGHPITVTENEFSNNLDFHFSDTKWPQNNLTVPMHAFLALNDAHDKKQWRMKPEHKTAWVTALRSGAYRQALGVLCSVTSESRAYCCLGVYTKLRDVPELDITRKNGESVVLFQVVDEDFVNSGGEFLTLPRQLHDELPARYANFLSLLNDTGWTFAQIADFIEETL